MPEGTPDVTTTVGTNVLGKIVLFKDRDVKGDRLILDDVNYVSNLEDKKFNDCTSSIVIVKGVWRFYKDINRGKPYPNDLGPGIYKWVVDQGMDNDKLSSLECIYL